MWCPLTASVTLDPSTLPLVNSLTHRQRPTLLSLTEAKVVRYLGKIVKRYFKSVGKADTIIPNSEFRIQN